MPYDDSDVKKMIKYQTERKVGFSRSKRISDDVKELIHCILEANVRSITGVPNLGCRHLLRVSDANLGGVRCVSGK